jgi:hypothetical protein
MQKDIIGGQDVCPLQAFTSYKNDNKSNIGSNHKSVYITEYPVVYKASDMRV